MPDATCPSTATTSHPDPISGYRPRFSFATHGAAAPCNPRWQLPPVAGPRRMPIGPAANALPEYRHVVCKPCLARGGRGSRRWTPSVADRSARPRCSFPLSRAPGPPCPGLAPLASLSLRFSSAPLPSPRGRGEPQPSAAQSARAARALCASEPPTASLPPRPGGGRRWSMPLRRRPPCPTPLSAGILAGRTLRGQAGSGASIRQPPPPGRTTKNVSPFPSPQGERGNGLGETNPTRICKFTLTNSAIPVYTHLDMTKPLPKVLFVATLIVGLAAALSGCRHSFQCTGELTPTLPAWTTAEPERLPAPVPPKE